MKPTLLVAVLFLATLGVALWLLGVFEPHGGTSGTEAPAEPATPAPGAPDLSSGEPKAQPPPFVPEVPQPVSVMVLGENPRSFTMWLPELWRLDPAIQWQMWFAESPASEVATHASDVPPLEHQPVAADLDGVKVLVLAGVDPARFPGAFWADVARRVREKSLGLLVLAEHRFAKSYADLPALKEILPISGARAVAPIAPGSAVIAGVFEKPRTFVVTDAGRRHPASRIVPYPDWSRKHWEAETTGKEAWLTKFCAPVEGPAADAQVLVEVDTGDARVPAFLATSGQAGRVLWIGGFFDLERPAYSGSASYDRARALGVSWVLWLAGLPL
jgi:hypothetical protein